MSRRPVPRTIVWVKRILRPILMVVTKRDWRGGDRLPEGGFVLAPNHLSHLDPILIAHFLLDHGVTPRYLAKDTLFDLPVIGPIVKHGEQIPVYRSTGGAADSLRAAVERVESGEPVIVYPEGTITRDPQLWPMAGRTGAVRVALATGAPLVPLAHWGAQEILWPYTKVPKLLPRKTIRMQVGDPVDLSDLAGKPLTEQLLLEATNRLTDTLTAMVADLRGELPTGPRVDVRSLAAPRTNYRAGDPSTETSRGVDDAERGDPPDGQER